MKRPVERIREGFLVLGLVLICSIVGYYMLDPERSIVHSLWKTVITISGVGYGEHSSAGVREQVFDVVVIVVGMSATFYTLGGLLQLLAEGEIDRLLGRRRMSRDIEQLENHVVVCGYGRIGSQLSADLRRRGRSFVVIESDDEKLQAALDDGLLALDGDATLEEVLVAAGVTRARTIVCTLPSDADNVFITLTSRNLNPTVNIIARAEVPSTERKLRQAGANRVVMPTLIGAQSMARMVLKPSTADLMELVGESTALDVDLDEIEVPAKSNLVGMKVRETLAAQKHSLLFVAIKKSNDQMVFNPGADYKFEASDIIIMMGRPENIEEFRDKFSC